MQYLPIFSHADCGQLVAPDNGGVTYTNNGATTYQEVATFTCDPGYDLTGDTTRTCEASGSWGGASPTCIIKGMKLIGYGRFSFHILDLQIQNLKKV